MTWRPSYLRRAIIVAASCMLESLKSLMFSLHMSILYPSRYVALGGLVGNIENAVLYKQNDVILFFF